MRGWLGAWGGTRTCPGPDVGSLDSQRAEAALRRQGGECEAREMAVITRPRRSKSPDCFHALPLCRLIIATGHKARQRVFGLCGLFERSSKYRFIFATVSHEPEPRDPREIGFFNRRNRGFGGGVTWRMSKGQEMHGLKNLVTLGTCMGERPAMTSVPIWTCCSVLRPGGPRWG